MENNYSVAISCHSDLGYIEYTADTKSDEASSKASETNGKKPS